ncbi:hypothetical protein F7P84_07185 [Edwardsiella anguillarum]|nr:hypothetical protein F7P84_07185 [Edwardsiella anguillarum]
MFSVKTSTASRSFRMSSRAIQVLARLHESLGKRLDITRASHCRWLLLFYQPNASVSLNHLA